MVDALHEKVKAEQEARMQRAIDNLEVSLLVVFSVQHIIFHPVRNSSFSCTERCINLFITSSSRCC